MTPAERTLAALTDLLAVSGAPTSTTVTVTATVTATWRERVHSCPDATLLHLDEAAEALGLSKDALRKRIDRSQVALPFTVRFGRRVFLARDVRAALARPHLPAGVIPLTRWRARPA